jgi:hypothetical protein
MLSLHLNVPAGHRRGSSDLDGWRNRAALEKESATPALDGLRPHHEQSLQVVPALLVDCWSRPCWPVAAGAADAVVVLALDGIGLEPALVAWRPDLAVVVTSTFPSTSPTAWLTATTGRRVAEHGVPGAVYRFGRELLFNCLADRSAGRITDWSARDRAPEVVVDGGTTVFEALSRRGVDTVVVPGDLASFPGRWADAVTRGARRVASDGPWATLRYRPAAAALTVVQDVDRMLGWRRPDTPLLVWAFTHLDPYVHRHGYDQTVLEALGILGDAAARWSEAGHTVVSHADHGLVRTRPPRTPPSAWEEAGDPRLSRLPPGGAGRVRWWYPHAGREDEVLDRLTAALGDGALVVPAERLVELGLVEREGRLLDRVGEIVALALGESFPLVDPRDAFEHGSVTPAEMLVPLAVWGPRR